MSDNDTNSSDRDGSAEETAAAEEMSARRVPHRVIGTPRSGHGLLAGEEAQPGGAQPIIGSAQPPRDRGLPAEPPDPAHAKKAERLAALLFLLSGCASLGFMAAYIGLGVGKNVDAAFRSNLALGISMAVAMLSIGAAMVIWVRHIMPQGEVTEQRHPLASPPADRTAFAETFLDGAESLGVLKRPMLRRSLLAAMLPLAIAPVVLLKSLGPMPETKLRYTVWHKGLRLVEFGTNRPLTPADFDSPGGMITVIPEGYADNPDALAKAAAVIVKFSPGQLQPPTRLDWIVDNIVCYSKICTHVGCPVNLYEQTIHKLLCPCHQSTYLATKGAIVTFGPAPRPLPQLPLTTDAEGYLVAASDFHEPVGPSFWERGAS